MRIIIHCKGQNYGPYSELETQDLVKSQRFSDSLPAWTDNKKSWVRLADLLKGTSPSSLVLPRIAAPETPVPAMVLNQSIPHASVVAFTPATPAPTAVPPAPLPVSATVPDGKPMIIINSDGQNYGPYTPEKVREFIRWGVFRMEDFAYLEGTKVWMRVVETLQGMSSPTAPPTPAVYQRPGSPALVRTEVPTKHLDPKKTKIIVRSGIQKYGPYNLNQIRELLISGKFKESDNAWSGAHNAWITIGELLDQLRQPSSQPALPSPAVSTPPVQTYQPPIQLLGDPLPIVPRIPQAPHPVAARRKVSGADVMSASSGKFGASI